MRNTVRITAGAVLVAGGLVAAALPAAAAQPDGTRVTSVAPDGTRVT
jgi:hypothetical protein